MPPPHYGYSSPFGHHKEQDSPPWQFAGVVDSTQFPQFWQVFSESGMSGDAHHQQQQGLPVFGCAMRVGAPCFCWEQSKPGVFWLFWKAACCSKAASSLLPPSQLSLSAAPAVVSSM